MAKIPEYFQIRDCYIKDENETILSAICRTFDLSGNEVRRLIKCKAIELNPYYFFLFEDGKWIVKEDDFVDDPNEYASEFITHTLRIGSKKVMHVYAYREDSLWKRITKWFRR